MNLTSRQLLTTLTDLTREPLRDLPERFVVQARQLGGPVAVYLVDVDGDCLVRLAGDGDLPEQVRIDGAVGPELDASAVAEVRQLFSERWPEVRAEPLWVLGRAVGMLVIGASADSDRHAALARVAGPVFELAAGVTDVFERGRRLAPTSAAAEVQLALLPPRFSRVAGGVVVGSVLPAYDVGGDWFDHADNPEGTWLAVADAMGRGSRAAAASALAVGAFRSGRRGDDMSLEGVARVMDEAIAQLLGGVFLTALLATWNHSTRTLSWLACGHMPPLLLRGGKASELPGPGTFPLGLDLGEREFPVNHTQLDAGDRVLLYTDGLTERVLGNGDRFGVDRLKDALTQTAGKPPFAAVAAIERRIVDASEEPVRDDATQLLLAVDSR